MKILWQKQLKGESSRLWPRISWKFTQRELEATSHIQSRAERKQSMPTSTGLTLSALPEFRTPCLEIDVTHSGAVFPPQLIQTSWSSTARPTGQPCPDNLSLKHPSQEILDSVKLTVRTSHHPLPAGHLLSVLPLQWKNQGPGKAGVRAQHSATFLWASNLRPGLPFFLDSCRLGKSEMEEGSMRFLKAKTLIFISHTA